MTITNHQYPISKTTARRFLLAHQHLWPPRSLRGKAGALAFLQHVGCIQFDPINVVGRNPDLVLAARLADHTPALLEELLYSDRSLLDGWDKVSSIYLAADWPYFERHRAHMRQSHNDGPAMQLAATVRQALRERGPLSSLDLKHDDRVDWAWGPTRIARAALETLYAMGELGVHHRVGTRRVFDLNERLLPGGLLSAPAPHVSEQDYWDWHVLRRVGGLGLANPGASEYWLGILRLKTPGRRATLRRLVERGDLLAVAVEGLNRTFFLRTADLPALEAVQTEAPPPPRAAFIAPLDNLTWDRKLLRWIFDFDYVWEVYKPARVRKYGYYVLPVLYGDRFVARLDPAFNKKTGELTIQNWWWEEGVEPDEAMRAALRECLRDFARYLNASRVSPGARIADDPSLKWIQA